ncbi:hypothetical protein MMC24_007209 [Lignoscripta atroalba]|nr:hypothetical protein [Lignoscripta atroalba]
MEDVSNHGKDRSDSGFFDGFYAEDLLVQPSPVCRSFSTPPTELTTNSQHHDKARSPKSRLSTLQGSLSSNSSTRPTPSTSRLTTIRQNSSRSSSTSRRSLAGSHRKTRPSSKRASSTITHLTPAYNRGRPELPIRSSSAAFARPRTENAFLIHQRGKMLFQSLGGTLANHHPQSTEHNDPLVTSSLSSLPLNAAYTGGEVAETPVSSFPEKTQDQERGHTECTPATIIDWTFPSTRRREYEKIDKSCRGLRGLWRRVIPQWCRRDGRMNFYDEDDDDSDAGSVRRYRVPLTEEANNHKGHAHSQKEYKIEEREMTSLSLRPRRPWNCFRGKSAKTV